MSDKYSDSTVEVIATSSGSPQTPSETSSSLQQHQHQVDDFQKKKEAAHIRTLMRRIAVGSTLLALLITFIRQAKGNYSDIFLYHPTSMAIACLGLMPEAISLTMQAKRTKSVNERNDTIQTHVLVSFAFKFVALAGYLAIWKSKVERGKNHFTTWHGQIGLASGIVLFAQVVLGALQFFTIPSVSSQRLLFRKLHRVLGSVLGLLMATTFALGFASNYAQRLFSPSEQWLMVLSGASCGLATLWALYRE